jgi:hypothetical protein
MKIHGKSHPERRRKVRHSAVMAATSEEALARAEASRAALKSPPRG